ncbi:MAG: phosphagen kinase [Pseudomonadota bacterium]
MTQAPDPVSKSLTGKYLSKPLKKQLSPLKTDSGFTLAKAIASGLKNPDSAIGLYAGDAQSYDLFAPLFDPIIDEYHQFSPDRIHLSDFTPVALPCPDPDNQYILSTRIRVARNLQGFNFPCHMSLSQRRKVESTIISALSKLTGNLKGTYVSLERDSQQLISKLDQQGLVFKKGDRFQDAAGINTDFPKSRGVFYSHDCCFRVWVNEEDHLRIMSMEKSSDIAGVFNRLSQGLAVLQQTLEYAWNPHLGYLNSCPTNIGTAMRASVHIRLKNLEKEPDRLEQIARQYHLQIRGTSGEKTKVEGAVFDISNCQRLGVTESMIANTLYSGVLAIIAAEEKSGQNFIKNTGTHEHQHG